MVFASLIKCQITFRKVRRKKYGSKKEIGIFTFMGLDNVKIGKMYVIEVAMIGLLSLIIGLGSGALFSKLFTMLLLRLSDISVDVSFSFSIIPVLLTTALFVTIFAIMIIKGYINILRSSVLDMLSASKQNNYYFIKSGNWGSFDLWWLLCCDDGW